MGFGGGSSAAASAAKKQADQQKLQYDAELRQIQNENALKSQEELATAPVVDAGGTAQTQDESFNTAQKLKRKQAMSSVLGI